jgi:hypothetical protein
MTMAMAMGCRPGEPVQKADFVFRVEAAGKVGTRCRLLSCPSFTPRQDPTPGNYSNEDARRRRRSASEHGLPKSSRRIMFVFIFMFMIMF